MAKSKSSKSPSATIGFEQQIWDAACELWGHIPQPTTEKSLQVSFSCATYQQPSKKNMQNLC